MLALLRFMSPLTPPHPGSLHPAPSHPTPTCCHPHHQAPPFPLPRAQAVAGAADPEAALSQAGVAFDSGVAVVYLSPQQLRLVVEELERMSAAMDSISIEVGWVGGWGGWGGGTGGGVRRWADGDAVGGVECHQTL